MLTFEGHHMPLAGKRGTTPSTTLFRTDRRMAHGNAEHAVWRKHLANEDTANANLLCNRLAPDALDHSYLRSSSDKSVGGWEISAARRGISSMTIERLDSLGAAPGSLQLSSSSSSLRSLYRSPSGGSSIGRHARLGLGGDEDDDSLADQLPADWLPPSLTSPASRTSLSPMGASPMSFGSSFGGAPALSSSSRTFGNVHRMRSTPACAAFEASLASSFRSAATADAAGASMSRSGSGWTVQRLGPSASSMPPSLDTRRPRPPKLISEQGGLRSALALGSSLKWR